MGYFDTVDHDLLKTIFNDGADALIENYGTLCTVTYPPLQTDCPNCIYNPATKRSSNQYQAGGPRSFSNGSICPHCHGAGIIHTTIPSDSVRMLLYWDAKSWVRIPALADIDWNTPQSYVQGWTYLHHIPSIQKSESVQIPVNSGVLNFRRKGEAAPQGLDGQYLVFLMERI
jgi:hypothetical protein